jgi:hypothetical protein
MSYDRGFLWTIYGCSPANPRKGDGKTASYADLQFLIHAALRSWRHWHPNEQGAVVDHDGSLSGPDRDLLSELDVGIIVPRVTFDTPSTLNKVVSLAHSPWPLTMHVDLDIVWTANAAPIWETPGDWDLAGVDLAYGHAYPDPDGTSKNWGIVNDGTPRIPCACVLLCRLAPPALLALADLALPGEWSDEVLLSRAELNGYLRLGRIPNRYVWDTWEGSGWCLSYCPQLRHWKTVSPDLGHHDPLALHWGGGHGKIKALASEDLRHYLASLP